MDGYIELRKYVDVGVDVREGHIRWVDQTQEHAFKAAELCILAEMLARKLY